MTPADSPRRLGRGLDALLARKAPPTPPREDASIASTTERTAEASQGRAGGRLDIENASDRGADDRGADDRGTSDRYPILRRLPIRSITPNRYQPRREFKADDLADLEASLEANGLLQPITVRPADSGSGYELIAGERRLRAATHLGWTEIDAVVRPTDDRAALTLALVENLQRADLGAIEEADGYQQLIDDFALSQQEVADVVGKSRSAVANALRLRGLPGPIKSMLGNGTISAGHARALLGLSDEGVMIALALEIDGADLSVRDVERRVHDRKAAALAPRPKSASPSVSMTDSTPDSAPGRTQSAESRRIEELLRNRLQTGVSLHLSARDRGEVRIAFFSNDDLERLLELLGVSLTD